MTTVLMLAVLDCSSCLRECLVSLNVDPLLEATFLTCPSCGWIGAIEVDYTYEPSDDDHDDETPPVGPALHHHHRHAA